MSNIEQKWIGEDTRLAQMRKRQGKELARFFPLCAAGSSGGAAGVNRCATDLSGGGMSHMTDRESPDILPDRDCQTDGNRPIDRRRTARPKATFQWPPDCLWPFIDDRWKSDS